MIVNGMGIIRKINHYQLLDPSQNSQILEIEVSSWFVFPFQIYKKITLSNSVSIKEKIACTESFCGLISDSQRVICTTKDVNCG